MSEPDPRPWARALLARLAVLTASTAAGPLGRAEAADASRKLQAKLLHLWLDNAKRADVVKVLHSFERWAFRLETGRELPDHRPPPATGVAPTVALADEKARPGEASRPPRRLAARLAPGKGRK